jgi:ABC-type sugar transport system ATPase subunit
VISLRSVSKGFGGVRALADVDLEIRPGEVHGLVGENGAGKSTLMKILAGVYPPSAGEILLDGRAVHLRDPRHAYELGIRIVYQELSLVPTLTVAENLYLHRFGRGRLRLVDRRALAREATALLAEWGLDIDATQRIEQLPMGKRQLVEIAREVAKQGRVLILDEPTSSLTNPEIDYLFGVLGRLTQRGMSVVFISHRTGEVLRIANRVTVLRNGRRVDTRDAATLSPRDMVSLIAGREIRELFPKQDVALGEPILAVRGLSAPGVSDISFDLRRGEILGVAGLIGAGRSELLRALFGMNRITAGAIELFGSRVMPRNAPDALALGIVMLSESRSEEGVFPELSVETNLVLMALDAVAPRGWLSRPRIRSTATDLVERLAVVTHHAATQRLSELSGGNQQKVVLGRLLGARPRILLLDEPTRGVDVGTKAEIHRIIGDFVAAGHGVIVVSSDIPELQGTADRIIVLYQGRVAGRFDRADFNEEDILQCAMGFSTTPSAR